jgi:hypothetical protein
VFQERDLCRLRGSELRRHANRCKRSSRTRWPHSIPGSQSAGASGRHWTFSASRPVSGPTARSARWSPSGWSGKQGRSRYSSPEARPSGPPSPARSSANPSFWFWTSPRPLWTSPSRRRSSTCCEELQQQLGIAYLLISHDLGVVNGVCDRVLVMRAGKLIEEGPTRQLLLQRTSSWSSSITGSAADAAQVGGQLRLDGVGCGHLLQDRRVTRSGRRTAARRATIEPSLTPSNRVGSPTTVSMKATVPSAICSKVRRPRRPGCGRGRGGQGCRCGTSHRKRSDSVSAVQRLASGRDRV